MLYAHGGPRFLYLAYGSNLNVEQMRYRCPGAAPVGRVTVPGRRLVFRGCGNGAHYLSLDADPAASVECIAWRVSRSNVRDLDRYEGYPALYDKEYQDLEVVSLEGDYLGRYKCMWYAMQDSFPFGAPSQQYLRTCVAGYRHFGLPDDALKQALAHSLSPAGAAVAIALGFPKD